jgi:hypothetical protein
MRAGKRNRTFMKTIRARFLPGCFIWLAITVAQAQTVQTNLAVTVRHAPNLNGGLNNVISTAPTPTRTTANCSGGKFASAAGSSGPSAESFGVAARPFGQPSGFSGLSAGAFYHDFPYFLQILTFKPYSNGA